MGRTEDRFIGQSLDGLSLTERTKLTGRWVAEELYSPERLPLRKIEAVGTDVRACVDALRRRGLNPARYYYHAVEAPY
jgi:hypothetical protein